MDEEFKYCLFFEISSVEELEKRDEKYEKIIKKHAKSTGKKCILVVSYSNAKNDQTGNTPGFGYPGRKIPRKVMED